jgi:hypothetical protein
MKYTCTHRPAVELHSICHFIFVFIYKFKTLIYIVLFFGLISFKILLFCIKLSIVKGPNMSKSILGRAGQVQWPSRSPDFAIFIHFFGTREIPNLQIITTSTNRRSEVNMYAAGERVHNMASKLCHETMHHFLPF